MHRRGEEGEEGRKKHIYISVQEDKRPPQLASCSCGVCVCVRADNLRFNTCNMHTVYMIYVHEYACIILVISVKCKQSW